MNQNVLPTKVAQMMTLMSTRTVMTLPLSRVVVQVALPITKSHNSALILTLTRLQKTLQIVTRNHYLKILPLNKKGTTRKYLLSRYPALPKLLLDLKS